MKNLSLAVISGVFIGIITNTAFGQITNYSRTTFAGSYSEISGTGGPSGDDESTNITLPFSFYYVDHSYTLGRICTNGWFELGSTERARSTSTSYNNLYLFTTTVPNKTLAPWWDDLETGTGNIQYTTLGSAPNRVFVVQWKNVNPLYDYDENYNIPGTKINFQVRLEETTNVIEFWYGGKTAGSIEDDASFGIEDNAGGSGHFIDGPTGSTTSGTTDLTTANNWPGVFYRFSPPAPPAVKDIEVTSVSISSPDATYFVTNRPLTISASIKNNGSESNPSSVQLTYKAGSEPANVNDGTTQTFTPSWSGSPSTATVTFTTTYSHGSAGTLWMYVKSFYTDDENSENDVNSKSETVIAETRINLASDGGGYMWSASNHSSTPRPSYEWIESGPGIGTFMPNSTDDGRLSNSIDLPQSFNFYDISRSAVKICTNGWLTFDTDLLSPTSTEQQLPNSTEPNHIIAALWDDLIVIDSEHDYGIYYRSLGGKFIVQWERFKSWYVDGSDITMQVVLNCSDNSITISYASPSDGGFTYDPSSESEQGSIGIEGSGTGNYGSNFYFHNDKSLNKPTAGMTIKFSTSESSLPVTLSAFSAKSVHNSVVLSWTTESEIENLGFIIEKHIIGEADWTEVANYQTHESLQGHGSTTEKHDYQFNDKSVQPGVTYIYLLSDVTYAGIEKKHTDKTVTVKIPADSPGIAELFHLGNIYPNPFNAGFVIPLTLQKSSPVELTLYDINGKVVKVVVNDIKPAGEYQITVDCSDLSVGLYFLRILVQNSIQTRKCILLK